MAIRVRSTTKGIFSYLTKEKEDNEDYKFEAKKDELQSAYPQKLEISQNAMKNFGLTQNSKDVDKKNTTGLLMQEQEKYDNKLK